jgi:hypothetical protein
LNQRHPQAIRSGQRRRRDRHRERARSARRKRLGERKATLVERFHFAVTIGP